MAKIAYVKNGKSHTKEVDKIGFRSVDIKRMFCTVDGLMIVTFYKKGDKRSRGNGTDPKTKKR